MPPPKRKQITATQLAYHEAGHAVLARLFGAKAVQITMAPSANIQGSGATTRYVLRDRTSKRRQQIIVAAGWAAQIVYLERLGLDLWKHGEMRHDHDSDELMDDWGKSVDFALPLVRANWDEIQAVGEMALGAEVVQYDRASPKLGWLWSRVGETFMRRADGSLVVA